MQRAILLTVSSAAIALLVAAGVACNNCDTKACDGGFQATISVPGNGPLPAGRYVVEVALENAAATHECTFPLVLGTPPCTQISELRTSGPVITVSANETSLTVSASENSGMSTIGPKQVTVTVVRDDVQVFHTSVAPEYVRVEDNGEGCGFCDELVAQSWLFDAR